MWFARAGFPPGARAKKNALLAPNHAQRLGAFILGIAILPKPSRIEVRPPWLKASLNVAGLDRLSLLYRCT
jgi:hypothetical protein